MQVSERVLGKVCSVHSVPLITPTCSATTLCLSMTGNLLLHCLIRTTILTALMPKQISRKVVQLLKESVKPIMHQFSPLLYCRRPSGMSTLPQDVFDRILEKVVEICADLSGKWPRVRTALCTALEKMQKEIDEAIDKVSANLSCDES